MIGFHTVRVVYLAASWNIDKSVWSANDEAQEVSEVFVRAAVVASLDAQVATHDRQHLRGNRKAI